MRALRVSLLPVIALVALWFAAPAPLRAQAPTSFDEYRRAVAQALTLAEQANALQSSERAPVLNRAADLLGGIAQIQTPSGALVPVNNKDLVALLRDPSETDAAVKRLRALRDALAESLVEVSPADVAMLAGILSRPPFMRSENWYDSILRAISDFIERLFRNTTSGVFDARDLIILFAAIVVVAVLVYFLRNLRRSLVAEESLPPALMEQEARTPAEAFDNAQRFASAGDYRSAVRQLYLATLLTLDQRGRIKYDPTLTNREYLHQASNDARTTAALQPIVETFDRTWYGFEPISVQEFDAYRRRVEQVREL
jgi:hypothetical protein